MKNSSFHSFMVSKLNPLYEKDGDKGKKKSQPTVEYKENISIDEIPGGESAFKSYMAMFSEALSCMDAVYSLAFAGDPESQIVKDYVAKRRDIGTAMEETESSASAAWDSIKNLSKELLTVLPDAVKNNKVVKEYKTKKAELDKKYQGKTDSPEYDEEVRNLKLTYSNQLDPLQITQLSMRIKASKLYDSAIELFRQGSQSEIKFIKSKEEKDGSAEKDFFRKVGDSMGSLILSKKYAEKAVKGFNESLVLEDIVADAKKILGKAKDKAIGEKQPFVRDKRDQEVSVTYLAENVLASLISLAKEIDNVISWKASVQGRETESGKKAAKEAEASASEMIKFLQESVPYVQKVDELLKGNTTPVSEIQKKLEDINKQIGEITRRDGILSKWKDEVLGEKREKTASASYLEMGRDKKAEAEKVLQELGRIEKIQSKIEKYEPAQIIKTAIGAFTGTSSEEKKPSKIKKRTDHATFSKSPTEKDRDTVKTFQNEMKKLGYLDGGFKEGEIDDPTKKAIDRAKLALANITGKVYDDSEDSYREFQRDLLHLGYNANNIRQLLEK